MPLPGTLTLAVVLPAKTHIRAGGLGVTVGVSPTGVGVMLGLGVGVASPVVVPVAVLVAVAVAPPVRVAVGVTVAVFVGVARPVGSMVGVPPIGVAVFVCVLVAVGVPAGPSSQKLVVGAGVPQTGSLLLGGCFSASSSHSERLKQREAAAPLSLYFLSPTKLSGSVKAKPRQPVFGQSTKERSPTWFCAVPLA